MSYVDYNDKRFQQVEEDKKEALSDLEKTYTEMIEKSDKYYQEQIDATKQWEETQKQNQQAQTDFAIEQIEQQKDKTSKDYTKEQSGAYVDWQKESNRYGAKAEMLASQGLANSGYSESSQVSMYNTYQNRVATAREGYNNAILNYNNAIKDARLQNNSKLAEIAYEALQKQLELSLAGFQYKNQLLQEKANKKSEIEDRYYARYQDVLQQINTEYAMSRSGGGGGGGGGGYYGSGGGAQVSKSGAAVNNEYYSGSINKDGALYGTYDGNQPQGIRNHGAVTPTSGTATVTQKTLSGQNKTSNKTVYQTSDGSKWYWSDQDNKYNRLTQGGTGTGKVIAAIK